MKIRVVIMHNDPGFSRTLECYVRGGSSFKLIGSNEDTETSIADMSNRLAYVALLDNKLNWQFGTCLSAVLYVFSSFLIKFLLIIFWIYAILYLFKPRFLYKSNRALLILSTSFFILTAHYSTGSTLKVSGIYSFSTVSSRGITSKEQNYFDAIFDEHSLLIKSSHTSMLADSYGLSSYITNTFYISTNVFIILSDTRSGLSSSITLKDPKYCWELGNCGNGLATAIFLTLRNKYIFTNQLGTRRLSQTWAMSRDPLSLITKADYSYHGNPSELSMQCIIFVDEQLRANWLESDLLSVNFNKEKHLFKEEISLNQYPTNFVCEKLLFKYFTNVSDFVFPMFMETKVYSIRHTTNNTIPLKRTNIVHYGTSLIEIKEVEEVNESLSNILPIERDTLFVSDHRLENRKFHVLGGRFETNKLTSFDIQPEAVKDFNTKYQAAKAATQD